LIIVGLPDTAVQEAKERVRAAIRNSGCTFLAKRITVNLAPAHLKKAGPAYDLPIAIGILQSSEQISADFSGTLILGELSLDGGLRHTNGILSMVALPKKKAYHRFWYRLRTLTRLLCWMGLRLYPVFPCPNWSAISAGK